MKERPLRNLLTAQLKLLLFVGLLTAFLFQGCALGFDHWKGKKTSSLISTWGKPNKTLPDRKGGKVLVYDRSPRETDVNYLGNYTAPTRKIGFYVNEKGIIYGWKELPLGKTLYK